MSDEEVVPNIVPKVVPIFVSCSSFRKNLVTKYVLKLAEDHNIELESDESIFTLLVTLIETERFILFMDFNDLTDDKIVESMITVAKYCHNFTVLAMSSGEGTLSEYFLAINQVFRKVPYFPFTEEEVDRFIEINNIKLTKEELLPLTGNNPLLLSLASASQTKSELAKKIGHCLNNYIKKNLKIDDALPKRCTESLLLSDKYFWIALNCSSSSVKEDDFNKTWAAENNICFLVK